MKVIDTMDYFTLLWMQQQPCWKDAINRCSYSGLRPGIETEGMAGYVSVEVELDINDISIFANLFKSRSYEEIMNIRNKVLYSKL